MVKKVAIVLITLLIVGLILAATLTNLIPTLFKAGECAAQSFLTGDSIKDCASVIKFEFKK